MKLRSTDDGIFIRFVMASWSSLMGQSHENVCEIMILDISFEVF
jgi:hypothetical protein